MSGCIGQSPINPTPALPFLHSSLTRPYPSFFPKPPTSHTCTQMHTYTQGQYIFIHDSILDSVMCGDTQIKASELRAAMHMLRSRTQTRQTGFESQFGVSCVPVQHFQACGVHVHNMEPCPVLCQILETVSPKPPEAKTVQLRGTTRRIAQWSSHQVSHQLVLLLHYHMAVYTVPSGQMACGSERREPRLHLCLHCACKFYLWV